MNTTGPHDDIETADGEGHLDDESEEDTLDFPTSMKAVQERAEYLAGRLDEASGEVALLDNVDMESEPAANILEYELEVPTSTEELEETLREIGAGAERLAEDVAKLAELRLRHLFARVAQEARP